MKSSKARSLFPRSTAVAPVGTARDLPAQAGFTLIELLVVIAIIGLLSGVVLASLNTARTKGADAGIKSNLKSVQTQAEIYYDDTQKYNADGSTGLSSAACTNTADTLFADAIVWKAIQSAQATNGGTLANVTRCAVASAGTSYAVAVLMRSVTGWFCIDSNGASTNTGSATAPALGGGASAAACP
jgi:prepilin-type N-terminal cleavage/methylation domain-containing protein